MTVRSVKVHFQRLEKVLQSREQPVAGRKSTYKYDCLFYRQTRHIQNGGKIQRTEIGLRADER